MYKKISEYLIVIVDDNLYTLDTLTEYFSQQGFQVITALTGAEAVETIKKNRPDVILLDVILPDIDGFDVAEEIHRWDALIPIIIMTGRLETHDKIGGFMAGAYRYLAKPCSPVKALKEVQKLLNIPDNF